MPVGVAIIHPSFQPEGCWIDDFVDSSAGYRFEKFGMATAEQSWHRRGPRTTLREWSRHFRQSYRAMTSGNQVVVASFPQLILACCIWKMVLFRSPRIVGWSFNFGGASKSRAAQMVGRAFRLASVLVTHSRAEIATYSRIFGLPLEKLRYVPLQCGAIHPAPQLDTTVPQGDFVIAMGSAGRDYAALFEAARGLDFPVLVIAKDDAVVGLERPANVEVRSGLSEAECWAIAARARVMALPLSTVETASGQVTFLAAMALRVPVVATRGPGTEDYLSDDRDALLVDPSDAKGLQQALHEVLTNDARREELADNAYQKWLSAFSDEAAAKNLISILNAVTSASVLAEAPETRKT